MGQESSQLIDPRVPPQSLESRSLEGLAKYIKDGKARRIVVMTGAGISTSAGIPDFRSPETGLYANLERLKLPYPEAVFDISFFRGNPLPFYALAHELFPGKYRPTVTHSFINLLYTKGLLLKLFTQNIDCLEREAGVPGEHIIEAHGSFASQKCIECGETYPDEDMQETIKSQEVPHCHSCQGLVKPNIVFFGEQLPSEFFANRALPTQADLAIVMGTSLSVHPFASLPEYVREDVPRLLINQEAVGSIGSRTDDVLLLGDCDSGVRMMAKELGWLEELEEMWHKTAPAGTPLPEVPGEVLRSRDNVSSEVDKLTQEVEKTLQIADGHTARVNEHLEKSAGGRDERNANTQDNGQKSEPISVAENVSSRIPVDPSYASSDELAAEPITTINSQVSAAKVDEKNKKPERDNYTVSAPVPQAVSSPTQTSTGVNGGRSPVDKSARSSYGGNGSNGIDHVFPHLEKKSSL